MSSGSEVAFEFESFRLFPSRRMLTDGSDNCPLGSRALDVLTCLVERAGEMVSKRELLERVWPGSPVDEANLRMNIAAVRKALGDGQGGRRYIVNLTGHGYCFVAPVRRVDVTPPAPSTTPQNEPQHNLPAELSRILGRDSEIQTIAMQLPMRRCVTLVGPGGIGKTTLAIAVARRVLPVYDDGAWFVDLSAISDNQLILPTVAQILGISLKTEDGLSSLVAHLQEKRLLLVFDNCEHVIDSVARFAEALFLGAPHVSILATSRETLRVTGEWVQRLAPMAVPPAGMSLSSAQAVSFSAVGFFVECAANVIEGFTLSDDDVPLAVAICRGLDGLPLAIELIAARIDLFGLAGLATVLEDPFLLLTEGRRGAFPRHQSLLRMLEWSYRLLTPSEQTILRRLSVFRGGFTLTDAVAIAAGEGVASDEIYCAVLTLSAKSLLSGEIHGAASQSQHRMLHVTRTLLSHKLQETAENARVLRKHAEHLCALLREAEREWEEVSRAVWLKSYARTMADVRAAIDWAFSPSGDASLGVVLTALALPLGFQLSLIEEFRGRVERALLHGQRIRPPQPVSQMRLNIALGVLTHNIKGPSGGRMAIERAVRIGAALESPAYHLEPLIGLATADLAAGEYGLAVDVASQASHIAEEAGLPLGVLAAERILAQARHFDGDHDIAAEVAQRVIDHPAIRLPLAYNATPVDRRVSMQIILARIAWIQGRLNVADRLLRETLLAAKSDGAFSVCPTLAFGAIPIAVWNGDDAEARLLIALLSEEAQRFTLGYWLSWASSFEMALRVRAGESGCGPEMSDILKLETFATFSPLLLTPEAVSREKRSASGWCSPELRRAEGEWLLAQQAPNAATTAEALFNEAIEIARKQGAVSWELRAATSLARLMQADGRSRHARELVTTVLGRLDQRRSNADLSQAKAFVANTSTDKAVPSSVPARSTRRRSTNRATGSRRRS